MPKPRLSQYRGEAPLIAYVKHCAFTFVKDKQRKHVASEKRNKEHVKYSRAISRESVNDEIWLDQSEFKADLVRRLKSFTESFDDNDKLIFRWIREGLKQTEIAQRLCIDKANVSRRIKKWRPRFLGNVIEPLRMKYGFDERAEKTVLELLSMYELDSDGDQFND